MTEQRDERVYKLIRAACEILEIPAERRRVLARDWAIRQNADDLLQNLRDADHEHLVSQMCGGDLA